MVKVALYEIPREASDPHFVMICLDNDFERVLTPAGSACVRFCLCARVPTVCLPCAYPRDTCIRWLPG